MDIFTNHLFDWVVLLSLLGGAAYTMKIIGREKTTFKEESYELRFGNLSLMIANWWTIVSQSENQVRFERTDTRYDWYATFTYIPDHGGRTLPQLLEDKLNEELIEFDEDVVFETDSRVLFRDPAIQEHFQEVIRVEGKGSQNVTERVYYDVFLVRPLNDPGYFIFVSWSSVLNGSLEGPFFEESLSELRFFREAEDSGVGSVPGRD
jgi:hypothetical protein